MIDEEVRVLGGQSEQVFVGGFSQGGTAAMATFLLYSGGRLGGCAVHSGANLAIIDYEKEVDLELKRQSEICMYHGEADPTVTLELSKRTFAIFDEHQLNYTLTTEPDLKHNLSKKGVTHLSKFLTEAMTT